jgi:predicted acylesterase/phospholipase RssA/CRP-like cAMP-binding protein
MTNDGASALRAVEEVTGGTGLFGNLDDESRRAIEAEVQWVQIDGGNVLFRQGAVGDSLYVVITGWLQAIIEPADREAEVIGDIFRGESVGEMAVLTGDPRSTTVRAVRDSTLVRFSKDAFERVTQLNPQAMRAITRRIIRRLQQRNLSATPRARVATVAIVPMDGDDLHREVAGRMATALQAFGTTQQLTSSLVDQELSHRDGEAASRWFDDQERQHAYTLYVADGSLTPWTARCIRQADRVLLVASGDAPPDRERVAAWVGRLGLTAGARHVELILLHASDRAVPRHTEQWLAAAATASHHHVRRDAPDEYERIARFLTGRAVGLVLGGGGARGFAHIGVIRALREAKVPIDVVGGTSMGAIIAAQCAMGYDDAAMRALNRRHWIDANPLKDKTLPVVAVLACRRLERMVSGMFGDAEIPDLWRRYFCVSADLTRAELRVHERGLLARAVRASMSLPGIAIPVYDAGSLLVDGGILNNLPADVMKKMCGGQVVAVNVTPEKDLAVSGPYPEAMSGWTLLLNRHHVKLPNILAIMMRTTMLGSAHQRQRVMADIDLFLNPAIERFGMFEWHRLDEIADAGYECARAAIERWQVA